MNTARGSDNDLRTIGESLLIIANAGSSDTGVTFNIHEIADGDDNLLDLLRQLTGRGEDQSLALLDIGIDLLEDRDGEGGSLSGTRLSLSNDVVAWNSLADDIDNGTRGMDSPLMTGMMARC
jgi:hypothetical protein